MVYHERLRQLFVLKGLSLALITWYLPVKAMLAIRSMRIIPFISHFDEQIILEIGVTTLVGRA